jgi:GTP-binding protein
LLAEVPEPPPVFEIPVYRLETDPNEFNVERTGEGWRVVGEAIERAAAMTYWEYDQSVRRFQRIMETLGIDQALRKTGIKKGDTVFIGEYELEWED